MSTPASQARTLVVEMVLESRADLHQMRFYLSRSGVRSRRRAATLQLEGEHWRMPRVWMNEMMTRAPLFFTWTACLPLRDGFAFLGNSSGVVVHA